MKAWSARQGVGSADSPACAAEPGDGFSPVYGAGDRPAGVVLSDPSSAVGPVWAHIVRGRGGCLDEVTVTPTNERVNTGHTDDNLTSRRDRAKTRRQRLLDSLTRERFGDLDQLALEAHTAHPQPTETDLIEASARDKNAYYQRSMRTINTSPEYAPPRSTAA
jgi:hypothetical protein